MGVYVLQHGVMSADQLRSAKLPGAACFAHRVQEDSHVAASTEHHDVLVAPQAGRVAHPEREARAGD